MTRKPKEESKGTKSKPSPIKKHAFLIKLSADEPYGRETRAILARLETLDEEDVSAAFIQMLNDGHLNRLEDLIYVAIKRTIKNQTYRSSFEGAGLELLTDFHEAQSSYQNGFRFNVELFDVLIAFEFTPSELEKLWALVSTKYEKDEHEADIQKELDFEDEH